MNTRLSRRLAAFAALAALLTVQTGLYAAPRALTLEEARSLALKTNKTVLKAELSIRSSLYDREAAVADFLPVLSATGSLGGSYPSVSKDPLDTSSAVGLSLSQTLFAGGEKIAALRKTGQLSLQAEAALKSTRIAALKDLDAQYLDVLEKQEKKAAADKDLEASTKQLEIAEAKYQANVLDKASFLESKSTLATKKTAAVQASYNLTVSRVKFASLVGLKDELSLAALDRAFFDSLGRFFRDLSIERVDALLDGFYRAGRLENPDLRQKELEIAIGNLNVDVKKAAFLPTVSLSWSHSFGSQNYGTPSGDGTIKLSGSIPLFPWQNKAADVKKAKTTVESNELDLASAVEDYRLSLNSTVLDLLSAAHEIESARSALSYAQEHYDQVFEKFRLSAATVSDLYEAEALLSANRTQDINSSYAFYKSWTVLVYLLGYEKEAPLLDLVKKAGFP